MITVIFERKPTGSQKHISGTNDASELKVCIKNETTIIIFVDQPKLLFICKLSLKKKKIHNIK